MEAHDSPDSHTPFWPEGEAGKILGQPEFVVPVVGAGVSAGAGIPGVGALAKWITEQVPSHEGAYDDEQDLMAVVDQADVEPAALREMVAEHIAGFELNPTPVSRAIVRAPTRFIVTFNYDLLLEASAEQQGITYRPLINDEAALTEVFDLVTNEGRWPPEELTILHLHGAVTSPESVVLDADGYARVARRHGFEQLMLFLMRRATMCFVGTTLDETHILAQMANFRGDRRHVLLCPAAEKEKLTTGRAPLTARHGLIVATYEHHSQLDGFAAQLVTRPVVEAPQAESLPEAERALPFGYVAAALYERSEAARFDSADELTALSFGLDAEPHRFSESEIALRHRSVIVGVAGSGKSQLLMEIGSVVPADEQPVLINVGSVRPEVGDALTVLCRLAEQGEGLRPGVEVTREAIEVQRFHFFFDGLDEARLADQEDLARMVRSLADAFPQHRFTVATRPIEAVEVFVDADYDEEDFQQSDATWRIFTLRPDWAWQQKFLELAGVALATLEDTMPALRDLNDLLRLPFFLSQTVTLHLEGRLSGLPDLGALLAEFVTASLEREIEAAPLPPPEARQWLRAVALSMHLSGRSRLQLNELRDVPLPASVQQVLGGTRDVAEVLVARLLLRRREGEYGFAHRMIGEALAAEALEQLEPDLDVLQAIVPIRDEEVRGARTDWLVPLFFLLRRSQSWREAVRARDPLTAARGVPRDASLEERREAARTIWGLYERWKIWIWDYEVPDLIEDAEALGRLLQTEGLGDAVSAVETKIDDPSPQVQGNAIRVLSRVNPPGFSERLSAVLQDDDREAVVRRQAAIAARDVGARELLPLIVERAVHPADDAEGQDCSLCALELASEEQLIETALALAESSQGRHMAQSQLKERATAEELLAFLRASAQAQEDELYSYRPELALLDQAIREVVGDE